MLYLKDDCRYKETVMWIFRQTMHLQISVLHDPKRRISPVSQCSNLIFILM